jgi:hypothetical protein
MIGVFAAHFFFYSFLVHDILRCRYEKHHLYLVGTTCTVFDVACFLLMCRAFSVVASNWDGLVIFTPGVMFFAFKSADEWVHGK